MFHGYRHFVCSLACVFSILCMLFLDICIVEARDQLQSKSGTFTVSTNLDNAGSVSGGSNTYSYYVRDGMYHFKIPISGSLNASSIIDGYSRGKYYNLYARFDAFTVNQGVVSNVCLTNSDGTLITNLGSGIWQNYESGAGYVISHSNESYLLNYFYYIEFDYALSLDSNGRMLAPGTGSLTTPSNPYITTTWNASFYYAIYDTSLEDVVSKSTYVTDPKLYEVTQDTNETAKDTNSKITDFFGSFFDNLLHIFVPEDGYFSTWFDKVNTLLSEKLGMLYAPFDLVISTLQAIYSSSTTESGIPFPGIKWEDTWLVEPFTFTFSSLGSDFDDLRDKVYFATDTVLVLTFLMLLQSKVKLILEGNE